MSVFPVYGPAVEQPLLPAYKLQRRHRTEIAWQNIVAGIARQITLKDLLVNCEYQYRIIAVEQFK